jgi:hypothetical protein
MNWSAWLELLGPVSITVALIVIGLLSKRLGNATRAAPHYVGFFVAALLVGISVIARIVNLGLNLADTEALQEPGWVFLYNGLPALGVTLGVIVAWRYWSWLLAERD